MAPVVQENAHPDYLPAPASLPVRQQRDRQYCLWAAPPRFASAEHIQQISRKVSEALDWAGISHLQLRNAHDLSGGERQRVAFARARILSPRILLLDEPTSNMDSESRGQSYRMIKRLKEEGVSIIVASHEFHTIAHLCDEHLSLQSGQLQSLPLEAEGGARKIIPYG